MIKFKQVLLLNMVFEDCKELTQQAITSINCTNYSQEGSAVYADRQTDRQTDRQIDR